jgi:hypothetical protein
MKRHGVPVALLVLLLAAPGSARACRGWANPPTLRESAAGCDLLVYGTLANPRKGPGDEGTTDVIVAAVLKAHPILGAKKVLTLPRHLPFPPNKPPRYLIFCEVFKGKLDPYRGIEATPAIVGYLKGLLAINPKDRKRQLRYCFDFLTHADQEIANDAFNEFTKSSLKELSQAARALPPEKLRTMLKDPKAPLYRLSTYGFLLGNCGNTADAAFLRDLAAKQIKKDKQVSDGVLTGYTLLDPKKGWAFARKLMANPGNAFVVRYAALRTARFFHDTRPDIIDKKAILELIRDGLNQEDMADLPIEDLRRWRCWDLTTHVLSLYGGTPGGPPIVRRAIMRYALQCPRPEAAAFVVQRRKTDADLVKDTEELLKLEADSK